MVVRHLFVYGSLRGDVADAGAPLTLAEFCGPPQPATVPGRLHDLGSYPGLLESEHPGDRVVGELYRLPDHAAPLLAQLDAYEDVGGGLYARRIKPARLESGQEHPAYVYTYLPIAPPSSRIAAGDYRAYLAARSQRGT